MHIKNIQNKILRCLVVFSILLFPLFTTNNVYALSNKVELHFLSTGNSDCIIIQSKKTVVIDAGQNDDETYVVSYLKSMGVKTVEYLVSTHPDADHSGGLDAIVNNFNIDQCFVCNGDASTQTYQSFITALSNKHLTPSVPLEGTKFDIGNGAYVQFYNCKATGSESNALSLITKLTYGKKKAVFMGDAPVSVENQYKNVIGDVDILKVSHHGSHTATGSVFLSVIKPEYSVLCTGKNSYGHPDATVVSRLKKYGKVYRTDQSGNIIFTLKNNKISVNKKAVSSIKSTTVKKSQSTSSTTKKKSTSSSSTATNGIDRSKTYVINIKSKMRHYSSCSYVSRMSSSNAVSTNSIKGYESYKSCSRCGA